MIPAAPRAGGGNFVAGGLLSLLPSFLLSSLVPSFNYVTLTHQETCGPVDAVEDEEEEREDEEKNVVNFAPELLLPLLPQLALLVRQLVARHPTAAAAAPPQGRLPHRLLLPPQLKLSRERERESEREMVHCTDCSGWLRLQYCGNFFKLNCERVSH